MKLEVGAMRMKRAIDWWVITLLGALAVAASLPLLRSTLLEAYDLQFHLARIEGIAQGLHLGQFPVRMNSIFAYGYGYPNAIFYPDLFLYFPAGLRVLGLPLQTSFQIFGVLCNAATCALSYYAFARMFRSKAIGMLGSVLYVFGIGRMMDVYSRNMVGQYLAAAFLPLVLYGMYRILTEETEKRSYRYAFLPLCIGMCGVFSSHMISSEMTIAFLVLACLPCCRRVFQKARFCAILKAAALCVLVMLPFIVPLLDYIIGGRYLKAFSDGMYNPIWDYALEPGQLFPLFPDAFDSVWKSTTENQGQGIGFAYLPVLFLFPYLCKHPKSVDTSLEKEDANQKRAVQVCYLLGLVALLLTTNLFPWRIATEIPALMSLQFPSRLLTIAQPLLVAVFLFVLKKLYKLPLLGARFVAGCLVTMACLSGVFYMDTYMKQAIAQPTIRDADALTDLDAWLVSGAEYIPYNADYRRDSEVYDRKVAPVTAGMSVSQWAERGVDMEIDLSNASDSEGAIRLPRYCYIGYHAEDASGKEFVLYEGEHGLLCVKIPQQYTGTVSVTYREKPLWRAAEVIALLTVAGALVWYVRGRKKDGLCADGDGVEALFHTDIQLGDADAVDTAKRA